MQKIGGRKTAWHVGKKYVLEPISLEIESPSVYLTNLEALAKLYVLSNYQFPHHLCEDTNTQSEGFVNSRDDAWEAPSTARTDTRHLVTVVVGVMVVILSFFLLNYYQSQMFFIASHAYS